MGNCSSQSSGAADRVPALPTGTHASRYHQRVAKLVQECGTEPLQEELEFTLRRCIDFCYGGGLEWAPHVRITVYADNPSEHQLNVAVYDTLLCCWGAASHVHSRVAARPIAGTDVMHGVVRVSPYWTRQVCPGAPLVTYTDVIHRVLYWFINLADKDPRKQLLINMMLQLHEAVYNCIGRHKEVFEFCIYDLIHAEDNLHTEAMPVAADSPTSPVSPGIDATTVVQHYAEHFLDKHKRDCVQMAVLSPLKFLYQRQYEVFENIDSHGASFWGAVFTEAFFPGLQLPYDSIVNHDKGWSWCAVDFLPAMRDGHALEALTRISDSQNIGRDWRSLTARLRPPQCDRMEHQLPGIPFAMLRNLFLENGFGSVLAEAKRPGKLRVGLAPYAARFAKGMQKNVILDHFVQKAITSAVWDVALGPALSELSCAALGQPYSPDALRQRLVTCCTDSGTLQVDRNAAAALLRVANIPWACESLGREQ
eukprot:TRINITY_DN42303_c0_g1_i4.p1 TRINITY_DN42303_c0_g1~~TRINITY_DN42303_c0_g1_i4.p1  ORF type:complete len:480 (-),score=48.50 TRINITY_DN42303_c0_g1_i4:59-1498(-)